MHDFWFLSLKGSCDMKWVDCMNLMIVQVWVWGTIWPIHHLINFLFFLFDSMRSTWFIVLYKCNEGVTFFFFILFTVPIWSHLQLQAISNFFFFFFFSYEWRINVKFYYRVVSKIELSKLHRKQFNHNYFDENNIFQNQNF